MKKTNDNKNVERDAENR